MSENVNTNKRGIIWTNYKFPPAAEILFNDAVAHYKLITSAKMQASNLVAGASDPSISEADIAFGQPDPAAIIASTKLKWVHLTSAGYDRYDRDDIRKALSARGGKLTTSSHVYDEPCAEHTLAFMLSLARQLPQCLDTQRMDRAWISAERRMDSYLLNGQTVVILSYGAIACRLIELLSPFDMKIYAVRRKIAGNEAVETVTTDKMDDVLPLADHVINILPGGADTRNIIGEAKISSMKRGAVYYSIGRGSTTDQDALLAALDSGQLRYAYLDVTDPEPLPTDHLLWSHPNCFITPHTAGGSVDEFERLALHFQNNLRKYEAGEKMENQVI